MFVSDEKKRPSFITKLTHSITAKNKAAEEAIPPEVKEKAEELHAAIRAFDDKQVETLVQHPDAAIFINAPAGSMRQTALRVAIDNCGRDLINQDLRRVGKMQKIMKLLASHGADKEKVLQLGEGQDSIKAKAHTNLKTEVDLAMPVESGVNLRQ